MRLRRRRGDCTDPKIAQDCVNHGRVDRLWTEERLEISERDRRDVPVEELFEPQRKFAEALEDA